MIVNPCKANVAADLTLADKLVGAEAFKGRVVCACRCGEVDVQPEALALCEIRPLSCWCIHLSLLEHDASILYYKSLQRIEVTVASIAQKYTWSEVQ